VTSELRAEPGETWARDEGQAGQPGPPPEARSSYREVFSIGEFRALWSAQVLSFAGDQFAQVAIAILVYGRTHSPFLGMAIGAFVIGRIAARRRGSARWAGSASCPAPR